MSVESTRKSLALRPGAVILTGLFVLICGLPCWPQQIPANGAANTLFSDPQNADALLFSQHASQQQSGTITGTVVDQSGARITGASVTLVREGESSGTEVLSDENGQFFFSNVVPGPFHLSIGSEGLTAQEFSGNIYSGEAYVTPLIRRTLQSVSTCTVSLRNFP